MIKEILEKVSKNVNEGYKVSIIQKM